MSRGLGEVFRGGRGRGRVVEPAADVDRDDVGALFGEPHRVAAALAARGAGDERDLAVYTIRPLLLDSRPTTCWAMPNI